MRLAPCLVVILSSALASACGRPSGPGAAADAGVERADGSAGKARSRGVAFDDEGVPLPDEEHLALGTAIPAGFEKASTAARSVTYTGPIPPDKVLAFYRRYLLCSHVEERPRGWHFSGASPQPPGDGSRQVDVSISPSGRTHSIVRIADRTPTPGKRAPPTLEDFEKLQDKAHRGSGSVEAPLPGTY